jgi:SAM-dependent methyltransferase
MFRVERIHWWYLGMQKITESLLDRWLPGNSRMDILDAGCGTGAAMTGYLSKYGTVTGIDLSPLALGFCKRRGAALLGCASVLDLPFAGSSFDLVTSFDVLYEDSVLDDAAAVKEFSRVLRPGGLILLRLPAYDWLRGRHDQVIHTARRYDRRQVVAMLQKRGLGVELASYANMFLFPFALIKRTVERIFRDHDLVSDLSFPVGPLNTLLRKILSLEAPLISRHALPFGLSVIVLARKN